MDPDAIELLVDGHRVCVPRGASIAAALAAAHAIARRSSRGEPRAPFCGMGSCQECRVTVNGRAHVLACQSLCETGMRIRTGSNAQTNPLDEANEVSPAQSGGAVFSA